jgi:hypothetical protein
MRVDRNGNNVGLVMETDGVTAAKGLGTMPESQKFLAQIMLTRMTENMKLLNDPLITSDPKRVKAIRAENDAYHKSITHIVNGTTPRPAFVPPPSNADGTVTPPPAPGLSEYAGEVMQGVVPASPGEAVADINVGLTGTSVGQIAEWGKELGGDIWNAISPYFEKPRAAATESPTPMGRPTPIDQTRNP